MGDATIKDKTSQKQEISLIFVKVNGEYVSLVAQPSRKCCVAGHWTGAQTPWRPFGWMYSESWMILRYKTVHIKHRTLLDIKNI